MDWYLLYHIMERNELGEAPHPRPPAPGAKAIPFDFEVPKDPWPEWLEGKYTVLDSPYYKSYLTGATASGEIEVRDRFWDLGKE